MKAIFTKEAQKVLNIWSGWEVFALEIEKFITGNHYTIKVDVMDYDYNTTSIDNFDIDFIENKDEILKYFLN